MLNEPPRLTAWVLVAVQLLTQVFSSISGISPNNTSKMWFLCVLNVKSTKAAKIRTFAGLINFTGKLVVKI